MESVVKSIIISTPALPSSEPHWRRRALAGQNHNVHRSRLKVKVLQGFLLPVVTSVLQCVFSMNIILMIIILLLPASGSGLHPPQCQWSLYQDIERLNCLVEPLKNNLIVEEEVYGIGPEQAKSLWVQCSNSDYVDSAGYGHAFLEQNNNNNYNASYFNDNHNISPNGGPQDNGYVLSHGVFMAVPNLRDLKLENCRITGITPGALSYLPYLQNLTIQAQTSLTTSTTASSVSSSTSLDIKPGVFRGLPDLRYLDLSTTSLTSLPNDFLCFLPTLSYLNLSSCWLRDFRSIGIMPNDPTNPHNCGNHIKILDLSSNHFTLLPPATFASVMSLEELRIDSNSITIAAERALLGLTQLKIFSLSGNQLTSLPPEFFKDSRLLHEIYLQNNSLSVLAPGLFNGLEHLVVLDLSHNELTSEWVIGETFRGLVRLVVLNLATNSLTKIDVNLFRDLSSLQVLNLENNRLSSVAENAFSGMYNMHTLLLSHNHLTTVDHFICNGLFVLSFLAMDNNKIESVSPQSFKNCSNVVDLNLSGNKLTSVPSAINVLTLLKTLDLGENKIEDISNASYQNLGNLYGLRLTDNSILSVPANAFLNCPSLKIINLAKNNITKVEPGAFDNSPNLQAVRLDSNRISKITGLFKNIPNLLWLNISGNSLEDLQYSDFPPRLQWLDLRSNKIHTLGSCLDLDVEVNLRIRNLDLSENYLTEIGSSNLPDSIENLILSHNKIHHIQPYTFFRKPNLTRVDLSFNQLSKLDQDTFRLSRSSSPSSNPNQPVAEILLGNNPLQCDCTMEWLQNMNAQDSDGGEGAVVGQYPIIQDVEDVKCSLSFDRRLYSGNPQQPGLTMSISYLNIGASQFLCKYESHCFSACSCCDFDACDCEMTCPKNCSCYHDQAWGINLVDCSGNEGSFIPGRIPMDVTELYLDGNIFPSLDSHSFIGRKNLQSLFLNGSRIELIHNRTFHGLRTLKSLHLENNFLERLEGFEFEDLEELEQLYLHENSLAWISNETFSTNILPHLRILTLHGNNFVDLAIWHVLGSGLMGSRNLGQVTLRGNEWSCECLFTMEFKDWLVENRAKISDASQVQCVDQTQTQGQQTSSSSHHVGGAGAAAGNSKSQNQQINLNSSKRTESSSLIVVRILDERNHRCSQTTDLSIREPSSGSERESADFSGYVVVIVAVVSVLGLLLLLSMIAFYWRQSLRVWFHAHCGLRLGTCSESPSERDKLFDAFVSYSSKDEAWVRQVLAAELERNDPPYRLCLRYRDLPTGGTYLADTIVQASEASRRTVLVLSHHFLKGEWGRTDVKSAHHSVLKDRSRKVIIILLGDLPSKDLDPDIRLYLKNHTYLNCEDKRFWPKLRYALPDVKVKLPLSRGLHNSRASNSNNHHNHSNHNNSSTHSSNSNNVNSSSTNNSHHMMRNSQNQPPPPPPPIHHSIQHQQQQQQQHYQQHHQQLHHQTQNGPSPHPPPHHPPPQPPHHQQHQQQNHHQPHYHLTNTSVNANGITQIANSPAPTATTNLNNSISTNNSHNNSGGRGSGRGSMTRPPQRHPSVVNSANSNRHVAIHI